MVRRSLAMMLVAAMALGACQETLRITVDAQRDVHPISPYIYGINQPLAGTFENGTLRRLGGNRWTAYNWTNNASNAGADWRYENDGILHNGNDAGGAVKETLADAAAHGAAALITVPINGYVSFDKNGDGDVRKSGENYLALRFHTEAPRKNAAFTLAPNPRDAVVYQDEFVNWVKTRYAYALSDPQRPIWFSLDNEPDLWAATHAEVHPEPVTYAELVQKNVDYAGAIKDVMPGALVFGPVNYGWHGMTGLQDAPDADGRDFEEFYLEQMRAAEGAAHRRLLDVLDVHWYPEATGDGHRVIDKVNTPAVVRARVQAPRSLDDPTYEEASWIVEKSLHGPINLIPRLQGKIAEHYPGTRLAITEYNYGGAQDISGSIAEADVLGIFGATGVFAACEWPLEAKEPAIAAGFGMFRSFDGAGGHFGETSIYTRSSNREEASAYAAVGAGGEITLVAINKTEGPLPADIFLLHAGGFVCARVFCLQAPGGKPVPVEPPVFKTPQFSYVMPAMSVSMLVLEPSSPPANALRASLLKAEK